MAALVLAVGLAACRYPASSAPVLPTAVFLSAPTDNPPLTPPAGFLSGPSSPLALTPTSAQAALSIHVPGAVPLFSQLDTLPVAIGGQPVDTKWSSCGPTSLAMVLNYGRTGPQSQDIVDYAVAAGLYLPHDPEKVFVSPAEMARIAAHYGVPASGNSATDAQAGRALLSDKLGRGWPVIVDVTVDLRAGGGTVAHFVVVTGVDTQYVYVNDPYTGGAGGSQRSIPIDDFVWAWRHNDDAARNNGGGWWMTVTSS